jgi:hypothetical protein
MISILQFASLVLYSYWIMRRVAWARPAARVDQPAPLSAMAIRLEDDPDQWRAARGSWTALDEHQLIRLLTDSAP